MQSKCFVLALTVLALLQGARGSQHHHQHHRIVEYIDVPNRIAWLPEGTDYVLRFLVQLSDNMITQYTQVLERIRAIRATLQSYPPAYNSIALFYDNDIQHPSDKESVKPSPYRKASGDAFKAAFETIQKFAGRRVPPFAKH